MDFPTDTVTRKRRYEILLVLYIQKHLLASRKIIYTADMTLETTEFDQAMEKLKDMVDKYGGYISRSNLYGYSPEYREQNFQIRIPAEHYQDFMSSAVSIGNIIRKNESVNDITAKYMDTEARLQVFRTEKARLEELMKKAETMEDILILDERISQVQSDIEGYEAQMRAMNDQVAMCTIDVTIEEVVIYTPTDTLFSTELLTAIKSGWTDFVELLQNIILALAYNSFTLVFFGSIGLVGYRIYRKRQTKKGPKARKQHSALQEGDDIYNTPQQGDKK